MITYTENSIFSQEIEFEQEFHIREHGNEQSVNLLLIFSKLSSRKLCNSFSDAVQSQFKSDPQRCKWKRTLYLEFISRSLSVESAKTDLIVANKINVRGHNYSKVEHSC